MKHEGFYFGAIMLAQWHLIAELPSLVASGQLGGSANLFERSYL